MDHGPIELADRRSRVRDRFGGSIMNDLRNVFLGLFAALAAATAIVAPASAQQ